MPRANLSTSDLAAAKIREMPWASDPGHSSPSSDHEEMTPGQWGEAEVHNGEEVSLGDSGDFSSAQAQERGTSMKVGKMEVEQRA